MDALTTTDAKEQALRRENMIALAREICCEFEKIHAHMEGILSRSLKKAA